MKRGYLVWLIPILLLCSIPFILQGNKVNDANSSPVGIVGNVIYNVPLGIDCSDSNIAIMWDLLYRESSSGIKIIKSLSDPSDITCVAFKNKSNFLYALELEKGNRTSPNTANFSYITARYGNSTSSVLDSLNSATTLEQYWSSIPSYNSNDKSIPRLISSSTEADTEFVSVFKVTPSSWSSKTLTYTPLFYFGDDPTSADTSPYSSGFVSQNYSYLGLVIYNITYTNSTSNCTSSWVAQNTSCTSAETQIIYHTDSNSCASPTSMPANRTAGCDYDRNGIIGNASTITEDNIDVSVYINSSLLNVSKNYSSSQRVQIREGSVNRIEFIYSFSNPLNLKNLTITEQPSDGAYGYLIVSGLDVSKNITIDRLDEFSDSVCVKNSFVSDIDEISVECNSTGEYLVLCPGTNSSFTCYDRNDTYTVSGLTSSAVLEMTSGNEPSCIENWECTTFSACSALVQTRSCVDLNDCGTTSNKPSESQACSCTSNWVCDPWTPTKCPKNSTQVRTCTDNNNCGIDTNKPTESQSCEYRGFNIMLVLLISGISIFILVIIYLIFYFVKKSRSERDTTPDNPYFRPPATYDRRTGF